MSTLRSGFGFIDILSFTRHVINTENNVITKPNISAEKNIIEKTHASGLNTVERQEKYAMENIRNNIDTTNLTLNLELWSE